MDGALWTRGRGGLYGLFISLRDRLAREALRLRPQHPRMQPEERVMNVKQILMCGVCSVALFAAGVAVGQENIDAHTPPHLAEAQKLISNAEGQIDAAQ